MKAEFMMRLSTKGRYGTRLMLNLAIHTGNGPVLLKNIAKEEDISVGYLEQIVPQLKTAGLINSVRGARGGYALSKAPRDIKLLDIIQALEGPMNFAGCVGDAKKCGRSGDCAVRDIWVSLSGIMSQAMRKLTLSDILEIHSTKRKRASMDYSI